MSGSLNIGDHIFTGLSGTELCADEARLIGRLRPAGFVLFGRNVADVGQVKRLCRDIYALYEGSGRAPAVAIDHEGWPVDRFARLRAPFPGNPLLGSSGSETLALRQGELMGRDLATLGVNLDFAPVLDLRAPGAPPVTAFRSFSLSPAVAGRMGAALATGLARGGVLACAKHFPGIGDCDVDPHYRVPRVRYGLGEVFSRPDAEPFSAAVSAGVPLIMVGHVCGPFGPGGTTELSTCSPGFVGALRGRMGFDGVLVSDDMYMRALTDTFGMEEAAMRALSAGLDILLMCRPIAEQESLFAQLERAYIKTSIGRDAARRGRMEKFCALLSAARKTSPRQVSARERLGLTDEICRAGLKPEIYEKPAPAPAKLDMVFVRPRYVSFPGASRIRWDSFLGAVRASRFPVGRVVNVFPRAEADGSSVCGASAAEKIAARFGRGDFVLVCCDGIYGRGLVSALVEKLGARGCRTGVVSVVPDENVTGKTAGLSFSFSTFSGLKHALELSAGLVLGIIKS